ncbi:MAG: hypothetical protein IJA60_02685 [Clostridia bacterium]|nr:hypothetical protein [Clostridia bacterium]
MAQYAKNTSVSSELSRLEIEKILIRYGAENFAYATTSGRAMIGFSMFDRQVKFILPLPEKSEFSLTATGRTRTENSQYEAWEQACRQRWRALKLVIQAKLEAVECGISVFEDEFMSNIVLPGGQTVGDFMKPQIEAAYISGKVPALLPQF